MERRNFLKLTGLAAIGTAAIPSLSVAALSTEDAVSGLIINEFDYLQLDKAGVKQYVEDYLSQYQPNWIGSMKMRFIYLMNMKAEQSDLITQLTRTYILSTDFFRNKMDETKPVQYLGLYNPYKNPCANPFSATYYPA